MKEEPSLIAIFLDEEQSQLAANQLSQEIIQIFQQKIEALFPGIPVFAGMSSGVRADWMPESWQKLEATSQFEFLEGVLTKLPASSGEIQGIDEVYFGFFEGIFPLLSKKLTQDLQQRHQKYLSQYSYSENLPPGIVPRFVSREFLLQLPPNTADVHSFLLKNLNQFDVEIFYAPPDLRQWRLDFGLGSKRSYHLTHSILSIDSNLEFENLPDLLREKTNLFRSAPSYLELEIFRGCELECSFCPRQFVSNEKDGSSIQISDLKRIIAEHQEAFDSEFSVAFGGLGEPLLHPDLGNLISEPLHHSNCRELILETALYKDPESIANAYESLPEESRKKLTVIVNLTTLSKSNYKKIYGKDCLDTVQNNLECLAKIVPKDQIYIQFIKLKELDSEMEGWYEHFQTQGFPVILQKYNRFAGLMPEKRSSDLTPIQRDFCWHLARDLYIHSDLSVSICKQSPDDSLGNLKENSLKDIWQKGSDPFRFSFLGEHASVPAPCMNCDEWYTFNA